MKVRKDAVLVVLLVVLLVVFFSLALIGCGGGGGGGGIPVASVSQTIGSEGGTVEVVGNKGEVLTMEIAKDALLSDTNISILLVDDPNAIAAADSLFPKVILGPEGTIFEKPIYLTFQIPGEVLQSIGVASLDEAIGYLNIYYWNEDNQLWEPLTIFEIDSENNTVVAEITHFSQYQLVLDWYYITRVELLTPVKKGKEFKVRVTGSFSWIDFLNVMLIARFPSFMEEKLAEMIFRSDSETSQDFVFTAPNQESAGNLVISDSRGKVLWEQEIITDYETDIFRSDGYYLDLIDQYSPILVFGKDERDPWKTRFPNGGEVYFPTRIESALEDAKLNAGRFTKVVVDNPSIDDLSGMGDNTFTLSFNGEDKTEPDREKLIYATAVDTNDYVFLQYWCYYNYDPKDKNTYQCVRNCNFSLNLLEVLKCHSECSKGDQPSLQPLTSHHGDFEGITVILRKGGNLELNEGWVVYGQHFSDQRMKHMDKGVEWTKGGVKVPWNNVEKEGTHPYVYIALGSHGCYPRDALYGVYTKRKVGGREFEFEYIEKAGGGVKWLPDDYNIEYLPRLSYLYPDSPQWESLKFLLFSGYWGNNYLVRPRLMTHDNKWINLVQWVSELQEKTFGEIPEPEPPVNNPPVASIVLPLADSNFVEGDEIFFSGTGTDAEDGDLSGDSLVWTSDKDGEIGRGESFSANDLSVGVHTITLTATDSQSVANSDSVVITITEEPIIPPANNPPVATITSPLDNASFFQGDEISFSGTGADAEDGNLTGNKLIWTSNKDDQIGIGESFALTSLSVNTHLITLTATDSASAAGAKSITVIVKEKAIIVADWPMLGQNPNRTYASSELLQPPLMKLWDYAFTSSSEDWPIEINTIPVVKDKIVYVGSYQPITFFPSRSDIQKIHAINLESKEQVWENSFIYKKISSLTVAHNQVYATYDYYELVAYNLSDGSEKWRWTVPDIVPLKSILPVGDKIYVGILGTPDISRFGYNPFRIYTLNPFTGEQLGSPIEIDGINGSDLSFSNGVIYAITHNQWDGGVYISIVGGVYAVNMETKQEVWKNAIADDTTYAPVISGELCLVKGSGYSWSEKRIYALDKATGEKKWEFEYQGSSFCCPFVASNGLIYAAVSDYTPQGVKIGSRLYAVNLSNGTKKWEFDTNDLSPDFLAASDNLIYVLLNNTDHTAAKIIVFKCNDGTKVWEYAFDNKYISNPVISNGMLIFKDSDNHFSVFGHSE